MPDATYFELVSRCGAGLELCPELEDWLGEIERYCVALDAAAMR